MTDHPNILNFIDPQGEYERLRNALLDIYAGEVDYVMRGEWQNLAQWMAVRAAEALCLQEADPEAAAAEAAAALEAEDRQEYPDHGPTDPWETSGPGYTTKE